MTVLALLSIQLRYSPAGGPGLWSAQGQLAGASGPSGNPRILNWPGGHPARRNRLTHVIGRPLFEVGQGVNGAAPCVDEPAVARRRPNRVLAARRHRYSHPVASAPPSRPVMMETRVSSP